MNIREETPSDQLEVDAVIQGAFGGDCERELVSRLRSDGLVAACNENLARTGVLRK
jgi:predicted N-acetyltransferase YhbS